MLFSIVIPNYNSEKWIIRLLDSIVAQTFKDYEVVIVDDLSTDNSLLKIQDYTEGMKNFRVYQNKRKGYNGGTRNNGVDLAKGEYIVFMDCDDYFYKPTALESIARRIEKTHADCIRVGYRYKLPGGEGDVILTESTPQDLVKSLFVAPWTKVIKRKLIKPFPENTLIEDVSQHIEQCDVIETIAVLREPITVWNCVNEKSISHKKNEGSPKRFNSWWRIVADLKDLELKHDYCKEQRDWRIGNYEDVIRKRLEN